MIICYYHDEHAKQTLYMIIRAIYRVNQNIIMCIDRSTQEGTFNFIYIMQWDVRTIRIQRIVRDVLSDIGHQTGISGFQGYQGVGVHVYFD